ncbi:outer membrane beta-barrel protein [Winogradskyella algicola]|uniref:outer membrane beta-barrel protein n=1 Tax=Winogradskyella algicola TaxID=2575815 RepID=UPI001109BC88|nr:outer membrane beta-barrel protein [Winogradskyella algicola]
MKKLLFTALAVFAFVSVNAQEDASTGGFSNGDVFITGSLTFGSEKLDDDKANTFEIAPRVGFFVSDNIAVGAELAFGSAKAESGSTDVVDMSTFGVGAFGRYYFTPANQFSLFGQLGLGYESMDNKLADVKTDVISASFAGGLNYFVSDNFSIEALVGVLGYSSSKPDFDGAEATNSFAFGGDWTNVSFGVNYKF